MKSNVVGFGLVLALVLAAGLSRAAAQRQSDLFKADTVSRQDNVGSVHLAIIGVKHLDEVVDELQPKFEMNEKLALESSVPITLAYYNEMISSFLVALKIAPAISSSSTLNTVNLTNEVGTTNSVTTDKTEPGDLSKAPDKAAAHPSLRDGKIPEGALGMDASTRYQAARTLFQEIKLMNRALKDFPRRKDFEPYVVTLQVTLLPYQRGLPYDAYGSVAFFSGLTKAGSLFSHVQPVAQKDWPALAFVATAAMRSPPFSQALAEYRRQFTELTNRVARLPEVVKVAAIPLVKGADSAIGIFESKMEVVDDNQARAVAADKAQEALHDLEDSYNKVVDVTAPQVEANPAVVPLLTTDSLEASDNDRILNQIRQFNFAVAAMYSGVGASLGADYFKQNLQAVNGRDLNGLLTLGRLSENALSVRLGAMNQSRSEFAMVPRTHTIALIVQAPNITTNLRVVARTTFRDARTGRELCARRPEVVEEQLREILRRYDAGVKAGKVKSAPFVQAVEGNSYDQFYDALSKVPKATTLTNYADVLWLEVARLWTGSQYAQAFAALSGPLKPAFKHPDQLAILLDDGKSTSVTLRGGEKINAAKLAVELLIGRGQETNQILAETVEVADSGAVIRAKFPSLKQQELLKEQEIKDYNLPASRAARAGLNLSVQLRTGTTNWTSTNLWLSTTKPEPDPMPVLIKIVRASGNLFSGGQSTQIVSIVIATNSGFVSKKSFLEVSGGWVAKAESSEGAIELTRSNGTYPVVKPGEVQFSLVNLSPYEDVKFFVCNDKAERISPQPLTAVKVIPTLLLGGERK